MFDEVIARHFAECWLLLTGGEGGWVVRLFEGEGEGGSCAEMGSGTHAEDLTGRNIPILKPFVEFAKAKYTHPYIP